ncbi:hypothetical protein ACVIGB_000079 [Bradyrhizobium sp. USDA 4341]
MQKSVSTIVAALLALACAGNGVAQSEPAAVVSPAQSEANLRPDNIPADGSTDDGASVERQANFGRVPWVLVIEAVRTAKGDLVPWDGDGDWARLWRVPGETAGTRYVPVDGDAEDRLHVRSPEKAKDSLPGGLGFLAGKYRAPAIALVVREPSAVAVIPWRGSFGVWSRTELPSNAPADDAKTEALKLISRAFPAGERKDELVAAPKLQAKVLAFRQTGGEMQYQVVIRGRIAQQQLLRLIEKAGGLSAVEIVTTADGYDLVLNDPSGSQEPVERRLTRAGLPTEPGGRSTQDAQTAAD